MMKNEIEEDDDNGGEHSNLAPKIYDILHGLFKLL
jgi:hypothetical protein